MCRTCVGQALRQIANASLRFSKWETRRSFLQLNGLFKKPDLFSVSLLLANESKTNAQREQNLYERKIILVINSNRDQIHMKLLINH